MRVLFSNEYLATLPKNELIAANKICTDFFSGDLDEQPRDVAYMLEVLLEDEISPNVQVGTNGSLTSVIAEPLVAALKAKSSRKKIEDIHRSVKALIARRIIKDPASMNSYLIQLSEEETRRLDSLLGDVRNVIRDSEAISDEHKRRLLVIVNQLQAEIDKEYSDFRVVLDRFIEASEVAGEVGIKSKPFFDRMRELFGVFDIKRKEVERLEAPDDPARLPAPPKALPAPEEELEE